MSTTFAFVTFAWIFFRADGMHLAMGYIKQIGDSIIEHPGQFLILPGGKMVFIYIFPIVLGDWYLRRDERKLKISNSIFGRYFFYFTLLFIIYFLFDENNSFIYFQF